jgi:CBS domain containing-hemolysin-like protein
VTFALGAFYSGSETALIACDRIRIRHLADKGNKRARLVLGLLEDPKYFLSAVLVGTNIAVTGCTATFTAICTRHFGARGDEIATLVLVPVFLVFNEIIPKGLFLYYANRAALAAVYPLRVLSLVFFPVIKLFSNTADLVTRLLPGDNAGSNLRLTMEEFLYHVDDSGEAGLIAPETIALANRALELKDLRASDVVVPLDDVVMVDGDTSLEEITGVFRQEGYSRLPVFRGGRGNIEGILSVHELMKCAMTEEMLGQLRKPYTISLDTPIVEVMFRMKDRGRHMALVTDGSGAVVGMTTLEDILEKFVGAIADEFN